MAVIPGLTARVGNPLKSKPSSLAPFLPMSVRFLSTTKLSVQVPVISSTAPALAAFDCGLQSPRARHAVHGRPASASKRLTSSRRQRQAQPPQKHQEAASASNPPAPVPLRPPGAPALCLPATTILRDQLEHLKRLPASAQRPGEGSARPITYEGWGTGFGEGVFWQGSNGPRSRAWVKRCCGVSRTCRSMPRHRQPPSDQG